MNNNPLHNYLVPNNNKKYYLLVAQKQALEQTRDNYNILYFFHEDERSEEYFFLEIDQRFNDNFLFEGYMYRTDNKYEFLITDILAKNNDIISVDFSLRTTLVNEAIHNSRTRLHNLNDHMSINIHPIIPAHNESLVKILRNNFKYKDSIIAMETIADFTKTRRVQAQAHEENRVKRVVKGRYTEVYDLFDVATGAMEGHLFIKGVKESKKIKAMFKSKQELLLECQYNSSFGKWQPVL
jgi:hypothetical protein